MTEHPFITCRQLIDFLADYLSGDLPGEQRAEFDRHLTVCPSCVAYLESYKRTIRLGRMALTATDEPASGVVPEGLVRAVRAARLRNG